MERKTTPSGSSGTSHLGATYAAAYKSLRMGKRLPAGVYIHGGLIDELPKVLRDHVLLAMELARVTPFDFDVVKIAPDSVSLLAYPGFWTEQFPRLTDAWTVKLPNGPATHRVYRPSDGTWILHRKELMADPRDPRMDDARELTAQLVDLGAFDETATIGTVGGWRKRLRSLGMDWDAGGHIVNMGAVPRRARTSRTSRTARK